MLKIKHIEDIKIDLISDYLRIPSVNKKEDEKRILKLKKNIFDGELPDKAGPVAEAIVEIFYKKLRKNYISNPPYQFYTNKLEEKIELRPDGFLTESRKKFWVEVKMRRYKSPGTANEKITNVVRKYKSLTEQTGNKLILFLIADDEHKFNREWAKLCRGEIEPSDEIDRKWLEADTAVLEKIIYGTEIANVLDS